MFCSGDEIVVFNPVGAEDEPQAEQETDYCNHVLMQKNSGFMVLHDWFHDALLQRNGYVLVSHETENRTQKDTYEGLSEDEFALLGQSEETEIVEHSERQALTDDGMSYPVHDVVVQSSKEYGCIKVTNIPPNGVLVAPDWPGVSLDGCPFVEVIDYKTVSELRADGLDVPDDISDTGNDEHTYAEQGRRVTQDSITDRDDLGADAATRRLRVRYVWMQYDEDGDGKAELRRLVVVGKTILDSDEDSLIPVACCTPYRMPHEHNGQSVADIVGDIQRIRTALIRGFLDNMYQVNSPRHAVDTSMVNVDDMLVTRPGGIVRVSGPPGAAIAPLLHPADGGAILSAVEYVDTVRENRTGVTKYNQGLDANSLNKTMGGITQIMSASQQRIELIARVIAETGMKQLMLIIHAMSLKHSRQSEMVKLRNSWVPVDPSTWKARRDVTVSVGLGTGNKDQMLQHLQMILVAQKEAAPLGLARPKNIYNALVKLTQNAGFKLPDEFWTDPDEAEPMPQGQDPDAAKAQAATQTAQIKAQADGMIKQAELESAARMQGQKLAIEVAEKQKDRELELEKAHIAAATQIELARIKDQSARMATMDDRQHQAEQQAQGAQREQDQKVQALADSEQRIAPIMQAIEQIREALARPLRVVRGADGRAAEIH